MRKRKKNLQESEGEAAQLALVTQNDATALFIEDADEFIHTEKNIIAIGFFTPTSKGLHGKLKATRVKTVRFMSALESGQEIVKGARIVTGGNYGLPGTGDLDKWLAFMKIVNGLQRQKGVVENPVTFTSPELMQLLGMKSDGMKNFNAVTEWLDRMFATTIELTSEGADEKQKRKAKRSLRVFDERVSTGRILQSGEVADRNHVWISDWLLESINKNFLIPIDFDTYRKLRYPIAKTLVPLLQIYLYASRADNYFEKSYEALCQLLGIKQYPHESKIKERLGPSLNELQQHGYLSGWSIQEQRGAGGYKILFRHGEKFHRDRLLQISRQGQLTPAGFTSEEETAWLWMLVERGVTEAKARQLISRRANAQHIGDQIEWIDAMIRKRGAEHYDNPPGLYIALIQSNAPVDPNFEPSRVRQAREDMLRRAIEREQAAAAGDTDAQPALDVDSETPQMPLSEVALYQLQCDYRKHVRHEAVRHLKKLSSAKYEELLEEERKVFKRQYKDAARVYSAQTITDCATDALEKKYEAIVEVMSFEEFVAQCSGRTEKQ